MPPFGGNPWWVYLISAVPALLVTILIFMDQQITAVIVNRKEHKLKVRLFSLSFKGTLRGGCWSLSQVQLITGQHVSIWGFCALCPLWGLNQQPPHFSAVPHRLSYCRPDKVVGGKKKVNSLATRDRAARPRRACMAEGYFVHGGNH